MTALNALTNQSSFDDVARAIIEESQRRGYTRAESIACVSTGIQESGLRPAIVDSTGHVGIYQQDGGYRGRNSATTQITGFLDRLDVKRASSGASGDIWLNIFWLQQRPGEKSADAAYANGRKAYLTEIRNHIDQATQLYDRLSTGVQPVTDPRLARLEAVRPDFNEFANWCSNSSSRGGTVIDCYLVHTQEGAENDDNAALDLSNFLKSTEGGANPVSYHDSVHQASDGGVTVVNSVDTDAAAWAVGNSNRRSINRCFAGSDASWTREQWLTQAKAIDVMAYLMVRDAVKYNSTAPTHVTFGPNYDGKPPPVFSDHRYCTKVLRDGNNHVDCGDNFPGDIYGAAVQKYWTAANSATAPTEPPTPPVVVPPVPPVVPQWPQSATDRQLLEFIAMQLGDGAGTDWPSKGSTLRDKLWALTAARSVRKPKAGE